MAKWLCTHRREIMLFCLLLVLMAFVGHFLADATGFSLHSLAAVDLHGNFLLAFVATLYASQTTAIVDVLPLTLFQFCTAPPTPPPPISLFI